MPEFQRRWRDWAPEKFPEVTHYAPDKTDESPSDSFVRPIAPRPPENIPVDSVASTQCCLVPDCRLKGYVVDLGSDRATRLCAPHRRELFRRTRELMDAAGEGFSTLLEVRPCRTCGDPVAPEDDPCGQCVAARSPLVQTALRLGAHPLCSCGTAVSQPGQLCGQCSGKPAGRGGHDDSA